METNIVKNTQGGSRIGVNLEIISQNWEKEREYRQMKK